MTSDRLVPRAALVMSIVTPIGIALAGLAWSAGWKSYISAGWWLGIIFVVFALVWWLIVWRAGFEERELLVGAATLAAVVLVVIAVPLVVRQRWPHEPWVRFAVMLGLALLAQWLAASDWSRRGFLVLALVLAVGLGAVVAQIGYMEKRVAPIAAAIHERDRLMRLDQEKDEDAEEDAQEAVEALDASLRQLRMAQPAILLRSANALAQALSGEKPDPDAAESALADFDRAYVPTEASAALVALRVQAGAAVDARSAAEDLPHETDDLDKALTTACSVAKNKGLDISCPKTDDDVENVDLDDALATLKVELARYRAEVTGTEEDKKALRDLLADAADQDADNGGVTLLDALARGPEAIVASASGDRDDPLMPGPLGCVLLGALALTVWTALLRRNARQLAGPVEIEKLTAHDAELRIAVLENVHEPGAAPGASATNPVTTLLDIAGPDLKLINRIITAVMSLVGQVHGYTVAADIVEPEKAASGEDAKEDVAAQVTTTSNTRVLVRVKDLRSKNTLETYVETDRDPAAAVTASGLWAAGFILGRSTRVPTWAAWNAQTAKALATSKQKQPTLDELEEAVRTAPNSGLLLYRLGLAYEIEKRQRDAVHVYARAVAAHPRYLLARYRLATALGMMCHYAEEQWTQLTLERRAPVIQAVRLALQRPKVDVGNCLDDLSNSTDRAKAASHFKTIASSLLVDLEHQARRANLLAASLRRSDRDLVLPMARSAGREGRRERMAWLARSARLAYAPEVDVTDVKGLVDEANKPHSWWQISYNAACAKALAGCFDEAIMLLEQCLVRPGVEQLDATWAATDPDLKPLASWPRFQRFCKALRGDTEHVGPT